MANNRDEAKQQALMVVQPPRLPMPAEAAEAGIDKRRWQALTDAVFPSAKSVAGIMLAIDYCKARNLDVFKRVVHVVPMWNSKLGREVETVWPGIGEMRTTAHRTKQHAGNDDCVFGRVIKKGFSDTKTYNSRNGGEPGSTSARCPEMDFPEWAQITVYKIVGGQRVAFVGPKVRFEEIFSGEKGLRVPNARWRQAPWQMLEKCAEAAALRRAFPEELGDEWSADEMEGKVVAGVPGLDSHFASAEEADGGVQDAEVTEIDQDPPKEDGPARDLNGWAPDRLDHYMETMRAAFPGMESLDRLDAVMKAEHGRIATLPDDERNEAEALEKTARDRLSDDRDERREAARDTGGGGKDRDDTSRTAAEPAFVNNLRRKLAEIEFIADLDTLEATEKRVIESKPDDIRDMCRSALMEKRAALTGGA